MIKVYVLMALLVAPAVSRASDDGCLDRLRSGLVGGTRTFSPAILKAAKMDQAAMAALPRSRVQYSVESTSSDFSGIDQLNYYFELAGAGRRIDVNESIDPSYSDEGGNQSLYRWTESVTVQDDRYFPIAKEEAVYSISKDCRALESSRGLTTYGVSIRHGDYARIVQSSTNLGQPGARSVTFQKKQLLSDLAAVSGIYSVADVVRIGLSGKTLRVLSGATSLEATLGPIKTIYRMDPFTQKVSPFSAVELKFQGGPGVTGSITYYDSADGNHGGTVSQNSLSPEIDYKEYVPAAQFYGSKLIRAPRQKITMLGFQNSDFDQAAVSLTMSNLKNFVPYENFGAYGSATRDRDHWNFTLRSPAIPARLIPWDATNSAADQVDLGSSMYVHPDKVKGIADELRPVLTGQNRLVAAVLIIAKVTQLIQFDKAALNFDMVQTLTTEQILASKTGVCQHFAGLYVAIARELGIPARQVFGLYLDADGPGYHAWVETKVNETTWWPLEPQAVAAALPRRAYFPLALETEYEAKNADDLMNAAYKSSRAVRQISGAIIKKIAAVPTATSASRP